MHYRRTDNYNGLRDDDGIVLVSLTGPYRGRHLFRLAKPDMIRMIEDYLTVVGGPSPEERKAAMDAARAEITRLKTDAERKEWRREHVRRLPGPLFFFGEDGTVTQISADEAVDLMERKTPRYDYRNSW